MMLSAHLLFPVHALTDAVFLYEVNVLLTCELTSLIRIQDLRFCYFESLFQGVDHHPCIESIIYFPADNTAAVPVDYGCQIQEPSPDGNIGNINRPCLVWPVYHRITQEIGTYLGPAASVSKDSFWDKWDKCPSHSYNALLLRRPTRYPRAFSCADICLAPQVGLSVCRWSMISLQANSSSETGVPL